jgi:uncharacterized protein
MNTSSDIFTAVRAGDIARVSELLAQDPSLAQATDEQGLSPIMIASYHRQSQALELLLSAKPPINLFEAAALGRTDRIVQLLETAPALVSQYSPDGFTALHLASFFAHPPAATLLIECGADVTAVAKNPMKVMPLHSAVTSRNLAIARSLLDNGAPVNARQMQGWTPLHAAAQNGDVPLIELLLQHGADPRIANDDGITALELAKKSGNADAVRLLE